MLEAQSWNVFDIGTNENLKKVYFTNDATGFIIGDNGLLLKTVDEPKAKAASKAYMAASVMFDPEARFGASKPKVRKYPPSKAMVAQRIKYLLSFSLRMMAARAIPKTGCSF